MGFCPSCGKEVTEENFCPACGKPLTAPTKSTVESDRTGNDRPTGITVLGILQIIIGIILAISAAFLGAFSGMIGNMMYQHMDNNMMWGMGPDFLGTLGGVIAIFLGILAGISFLIAWALFSAKRWGRTLVIVFSIIDLVFAAASLFSGNGFGVASIILDAIILYYMWRPHVIAYFNK